MVEDSLPIRKRIDTRHRIVVRQDLNTTSQSLPSDTQSSTQGTQASTSNLTPSIVTTESAGDSPSTALSTLTDSVENISASGSTAVPSTNIGTSSALAATASQTTTDITGATTTITDGPTSAPTDTSASGEQSILPSDGVTSDGGSSGVTDGTSVTASDTSGATSSTDGSPSTSPTTTSATSDTSTTDSSSTSLTSSTISTTLSDTTSTPTPTDTLTTTTSESSQTSSTDSTESSSTTDTPQSASTSFTTSFSEIVTTVNGAITTIFSPVPTLNSDNTSVQTSARRTAAIAGGAIGGAALLLLFIAFVFCCRRHQKRLNERAHRRLPTPRSMLLAGEDDFDLAGPSTKPSGIRRGLGILGSLARGGRNASTRRGPSEKTTQLNVGSRYRDTEEGGHPEMSTYGAHGSLAALSEDTPENRALDGAPPRLLRPRTSGSGSVFEEHVWPPPREGLRDPLMAASSVDLTSVVEEVMGPNQDGASPIPGSVVSIADTSRSARIRGGAESESLLVEPDVDEVDAMGKLKRESGSTRDGGRTPDTSWHHRDWSVGSQAPLLTHVDGASPPPSSYPYSHQRHSSGSGTWLPPGAARAVVPGVDTSYSYSGSKSALNLPASGSRTSFQAPSMHPSVSGSSARPQSKLWIDRLPRQSIDSKTAAEAQARRLSVSNPDDIPPPASPSSPSRESFPPAPPPPPPPKEPRSPDRANTGQTLASSFSLSTSSTHRLKNAQGGDVYNQPAIPDRSEIDPQSPARSLSLGHSILLPGSASVRLVDVEEAPEQEPASEFQEEPIDEIPPRYDMIRRDTELSEIQRSIRRTDSPHEDVGRAL